LIVLLACAARCDDTQRSEGQGHQRGKDDSQQPHLIPSGVPCTPREVKAQSAYKSMVTTRPHDVGGGGVSFAVFVGQQDGTAERIEGFSHTRRGHRAPC
jgi:hypothetical protein